MKIALAIAASPGCMLGPFFDLKLFVGAQNMDRAGSFAADGRLLRTFVLAGWPRILPSLVAVAFPHRQTSSGSLRQTSTRLQDRSHL